METTAHRWLFVEPGQAPDGDHLGVIAAYLEDVRADRQKNLERCRDWAARYWARALVALLFWMNEGEER
jgi:hypothetical protein